LQGQRITHFGGAPSAPVTNDSAQFLDLTAAASDPADAVCARSTVGSVVSDPPAVSSQNGVLEVTFKYQTTVDANGLTRYCYVYTTPSGQAEEAPTLEVNPGDQLIIHFYNQLPAPSAADVAAHQMRGMKMAPAASAADSACSATSVTAGSTNLHFHGTNVAPVCHQDEVVHTLIQPQTEFDYQVQIPANEPPGAYWYHPHPHGFSNNQVVGGASGVILVGGIQNVNPIVANLPQRVFVLRDQDLPRSEASDPSLPATDLSINYVPILYPSYTPAVIQTPPSQKEFWRVLNTSADTLLDLQVNIAGVAQPLQVVAVDGVPITDANGNASTVTQTNYVLAPAARVEFIVTTPAAGAAAQLVTLPWNNGPSGDADPGRPIANIVSNSSYASAAAQPGRLPAQVHPQAVTRFAAINASTPVTQRTLYFSTNFNVSPPQFYITVDGQTPAVFNMDAPPNLTVTGGTVEQWTVENRSTMDHTFHIHQLHFQTLAINGVAVDDTTRRDSIDIPHWSGNSSDGYPSVTLLMDFRDPNIVGTFVYHCHILSHEDLGMMGTIEVLPGATTTNLTASPTSAPVGTSITLTATVAPSGGSGTPAGTVTFNDGSIALGTATLNGSAVATLATTTLPIGTQSITAVYSGDTSFAASTSSAVNVSVTGVATTATTLTSSASTISHGSGVTLTATVSTTAGGGIPEGSVAFQSGGATLGTANLNGSGVAALTTTTLPVGSNSITAAYGGATGFGPSTSAPVAVTVGTVALQFIPVTPCRVADTRNATGPFGGPELAAGASRVFDVPQSSCGIPSAAVAYSLNVTVVPTGVLDYLTLWPSGEAQPVVSTLNSLDGRVKANAAITPAGVNGGVSVFAYNATHVILDIDGYFVPSGAASALAFYPVTPCRVADTRGATGALGGPFMPANSSRAFRVLSSNCGLPPTAQAYSLNVTAVPHTILDYVTAWPTGQAQPVVSTLNATTGAVTANAAIVPAASNGEISLFVSNDADIVLDINGYFAAPATGGLSLYTTAPCRAIDTRNGAGAFDGGFVAPIQTSSCAPPATAKSYVLNSTVVPPAVLNYLTLWPNGLSQPAVSTLNAVDGAVTSNMAIVENVNGNVDAYSSDSTQLILDLSGYFAP
jgi:FtsP/CotA-like multicopper oxidase with cupredoxin domain